MSNYANMVNNNFVDSYNGFNKVSKNLLIGSDFTLNPWQRGTTFTSIATGAYCADRFRIDYVTSGVVDITRSTNAPSVALAGVVTSNSLSLAVTTADAAIAAGDFMTISQFVEGYNFSRIAQAPMTLQFLVNSSKTGVYCVALNNSGSDRSYVAEYTITAANTWQRVTIVVPASPSAGTWNYTNGIGLRVRWTIAAGSNFQGTANAWQSSNIYATSNQVNGLDSNTNTFLIACPQLEKGTVATVYAEETIQQVLSGCQRYYFKTFPQGTAPAQNTASVVGALVYRAVLAGINSNGQYLAWPVTMNATPTTVTTYNPNNTNANWRNSTAAADSGVPSLLSTSDCGVFVVNPQIVTDAIAGTMSIHLSAEAEL
jgi:hypothetical protein